MISRLEITCPMVLYYVEQLDLWFSFFISLQLFTITKYRETTIKGLERNLLNKSGTKFIQIANRLYTSMETTS